MNHRKQLLEQYEDAKFALLMDSVAEQEGYELLKEAERLNNDPNAAIPHELDQKCMRIIKHGFWQKQVKSAGHLSVRVIKRIAVVLVAAVMLMAVAYATIPQVRVGVLNLILTITDEYTNLGLQQEGTSQRGESGEHSGRDAIPYFDIPNAVDGYSLTVSESFKSERSYCYESEEGCEYRISISVASASSAYLIDTEDAQVVQNIAINGYKGIYIENKGWKTVVWVDTDHSVYVDVSSNSLDMQTLLQLAEEIKYVKNF